MGAQPLFSHIEATASVQLLDLLFREKSAKEQLDGKFENIGSFASPTKRLQICGRKTLPVCFS